MNRFLLKWTYAVSMAAAGFCFAAGSAKVALADDPNRDRDPGRGRGRETYIINCESRRHVMNRCGVDGRIIQVNLEQDFSRRGGRCEYGRTWGYDENSVWVDRGCQGRFRVEVRRRDHGDGRDNAPIGFLDGVNSTRDGVVVMGWACDQDNQGRSIDVHFYIDGPAGSGIFAGAINANRPRPDVNRNSECRYGDHGYEFWVPRQFLDGRQHTIYAYGIDSSGRDYLNRELSNSPAYFNGWGGGRR